MRIAIDVQGAQTSGSAFRGIGRYTVALAQSIARLRVQHEVIIVASDAFPESIQRLRDAFVGILPYDCFKVWQCPKDISSNDEANLGRRAAAELVRECYIASLLPDVLLVSSLFEGFGDNAIASIGMMHTIPTAVVLFDLIPYIHRGIYLPANSLAEEWYETQLSHLRRADLVLAISESSRREAENYLGFDGDFITTVGTAADPQFHRHDFPRSELDAVLARYGLNRHFVMYTGGIDHRKNVERLICSFARLPPELRHQHQLAIVCKADGQAQNRLNRLAENEGLGNSDLVLTQGNRTSE